MTFATPQCEDASPLQTTPRVDLGFSQVGFRAEFGCMPLKEILKIRSLAT